MRVESSSGARRAKPARPARSARPAQSTRSARSTRPAGHATSAGHARPANHTRSARRARSWKSYVRRPRSRLVAQNSSQEAGEPRSPRKTARCPSWGAPPRRTPLFAGGAVGPTVQAPPPPKKIVIYIYIYIISCRK